MMKLGGWIVMLVSLVLFVTLFGFETSVSPILEKVGISINSSITTVEGITVDTEGSTFWSWMFGTEGFLVALGVSGLVAIGLFGKGYDPSLVYAPFLVALSLAFISTFVGVITEVAKYGQVWMSLITSFIFGVLAVGFVFSAIGYFGGRQ